MNTMATATRYEVTKHFVTGIFAGMDLTSTTSVEMPLGEYVEVLTNDRYIVTECRPTNDYLGRTI